MSTRIEIPYDRTHTDADLQAITSRSAATLNVMQQLGVDYQTLPGYKMVDYQAEADALEADMAAINSLMEQIRLKLITADAKARPLEEKNKGSLKALSGLLTGNAQQSLLAQITGPTAQGGGSGGGATTPPPA